MRENCNLFNVLLAISLLASSVCVTAEDPSKAIDDQNIIERIKAYRDGVGHLLVPVMIQGKKYPFILDTGTKDIIFDISLRSVLGKPRKILTMPSDFGNIELQSFDTPEAFVGKQSLQSSSNVIMSDLTRMRDWLGCDFYGIIGMSFLKHYIVKIDFDKEEVLFLKSTEGDLGEHFRICCKHAIPYIEIVIPAYKCKEKFVIDTGADINGAGTILYSLYKQLDKNNISTALQNNHQRLTFTGVVVDSDFRLGLFSIGSFSHCNLIFSSSPKCGNALGLGYLSRYVITFDFPHDEMYLQRGKMFDLPDGRDCSGLSIARHRGKTIIPNVDWFSPAWWCGIKPQDVILSIDGISTNQVSLYSLRRLLSMEGKKVRLALQRGPEHVEVFLLLKRSRSRTD